ncbi:fungal zn(2)-Cys(6) binuclear cluster domain protein [Fusarium beomiforme]|uniref:Fungal zn(2)-Cys(6) binuclear cluster domain protein n=1 Tax=Fusarium beomiforme TaxID=44412 RepID=A0A9P5DSR8_9HYPO|nr:fungal zn(2)-Cys(6) binuclear cluster domain protein [Fusarium beomiforme]
MVGRASKKKHSSAPRQSTTSLQCTVPRSTAVGLDDPLSISLAGSEPLDTIGNELPWDALFDMQLQNTGDTQGDSSSQSTWPNLSVDDLIPNSPHGQDAISSQTTVGNTASPMLADPSSQLVDHNWPRPLPSTAELANDITSPPVNHDSHSFHMVTLGKCIAVLDSQLAAIETTKIDMVLNISKNSLDQIAYIMGLDSYESCRSCKTLVSSIVESVLALYEKASARERTSSDILQSRPRLSLGVYTIDIAEHPVLYRQVINTELQRLTPVIQSLKSGCGANPASARRARHQDLFLEMEQRLELLFEATK